MYFYDHQIFSMQTYGGVSRYWLELLRALGRSADKPVVLFTGLHFSQFPLSELNPEVRLLGARLPFTPPRGSKYLRMASGLVCRQVLKYFKPKIYHPTYYDFIESPNSCGRVVTVHDMIHEKFYGRDHPGSIQKVRAVNHADRLICVSWATRNDLLSYYPSLEERCFVVHHGVRRLTTPKSDVRLPQTPFILYVGNRREYKNFACLLKALQVMPRPLQPHLLCFGGEPWSSNDLAIIAKAGLSNKFHTLRGDDSTLTAAYCGAKMLVYPSLYEGFGLPILEAMQCGCPVVCSNSSSLPEVAGDAAMYFDPKNSEELASVIGKLLEQDSVCSELRQKGYERAAQFSWEKAAQQTLNVYETL